MERRNFLIRSGLALGAVAASGGGRAIAASKPAPAASLPAGPDNPQDWAWVRDQFDLMDPKIVNLGGFYLVSHPKTVRAAIEKHRAGLDLNPIKYQHQGFELENAVREAAGEYLGVNGKNEVVLTDSTTMGLALLYTGLKIRADQEILTSTHDHPAATIKSLSLRAARDGTKINTIKLYQDSAHTTADEIVGNIAKSITAKTRLLALTWVHSNSGVKIPVRAIADVVTKANTGRSPDERLIFSIDGVHGLGIDDVTLPSLGCDFFAAGTHKWIFSPRGTGILWGRAELWEQVVPTIPAFGMMNNPAIQFSPGGFHSFEHRWAQDEGFKLHLAIGKGRIQERLHQLNSMVRDGLSKMAHVDLHTPMSRDLAAGITCFDVKGKKPSEVIDHLDERGIMGSASPYIPSRARLACSVWNTEEQVERALKAVRELA